MSIAEYLGENPASVSGGVDGNAYAVMGATKRAIKKALLSAEFDSQEINSFLEGLMEEAMSGDYNNLLCVCTRYVEFF